ncbi:MAG: S8 family serine peptidase [Elainella sp. Prado103]|nr:S8 family serine peptidase [Elainella sp. Prado103]
MKRFLSSLLLTSLFWSTFNLSKPLLNFSAIAQTNPELSYSFYGKSIPLTLREHTIAVSFRQIANTRGIERPLPVYLQLQQDLQTVNQTQSRGMTAPAIQVQPLGENYALVTFSANTRENSQIDRQIRQQSYVAETLPVLSLSGVEDPSASFVLPNEIVISFDPDLTDRQRQALLDREGLEIIRPLQFTQHRYLARSKSRQGLAVLHLANRLNRQVGIQSATPNFIQSLSYQQDTAAPLSPTELSLEQQLNKLPRIDAAYPSQLLPLAWHLNSTAQRPQSQPRTDVHATEAWRESNGGEGVVIAVIDSLIQWDHPDLMQRVHTADPQTQNLLPGEVHGWDFTGDRQTCSDRNPRNCVMGDPDTRLSEAELTILKTDFQNTFQLSDQQLLNQYKNLANQVRSNYPDYSDAQVANTIRDWIRSSISAEFHGTWASGVIVAHPQNAIGAIGVAPQAEILPVRVFGLRGEITAARLIEAVGYAAERGVDVINLSLGGLLPNQELTDQIFQVLDADPNLAIVAAAGNESLDGVAFPAAIPGVISVGATNLQGKRTFYSSYGGRLNVVAPGGETAIEQRGGILTTGGTWLPGFWQGLEPPKQAWASSLDPLGQYVQVQGTSFSSPIVAGVVALMKGVNPELSRDRVREILEDTASYDGLTLSRADLNHYRLQSQVGMTMLQDRLSGIFPMPKPVSAEQYFYGYGLVNAEAAVQQAKREQ